jgi:hypothetical protein
VKKTLVGGRKKCKAEKYMFAAEKAAAFCLLFTVSVLKNHSQHIFRCALDGINLQKIENHPNWN